MCLPNFIEFKQIEESNPLIGYRSWFNPIKSFNLKSISKDYTWKPNPEGPHKVEYKDSGLYSNNYYYNNFYNYHNYHNYYHNYNYYYYNDNYNLGGIILQYGKVAIHEMGQRSEFARIDKLFTIRESDASGSQFFINWIKEFNLHVTEIANKYNCKTIHWQDFIERQ